MRENLKKARKDAGMTQQQMADRSHKRKGEQEHRFYKLRVLREAGRTDYPGA